MAQSNMQVQLNQALGEVGRLAQLGTIAKGIRDNRLSNYLNTNYSIDTGARLERLNVDMNTKLNDNKGTIYEKDYNKLHSNFHGTPIEKPNEGPKTSYDAINKLSEELSRYKYMYSSAIRVGNWGPISKDMQNFIERTSGANNGELFTFNIEKSKEGELNGSN